MVAVMECKLLVRGWKRQDCEHLRQIALVCNPTVAAACGNLRMGDVGWEVSQSLEVKHF